MGCASSKQPVCRNCHAPYSPMTRSYSMHVHHPPQQEGDTYHVVALTSTTLGYLQVEPSKSSHIDQGKDPAVVQFRREQNEPEKTTRDFAVEVIEAKTWSKMIEEKIPKVTPKTPVRTPPGEPETINAWELMEGLEDTTPLRPPSSANHIRSFSFHVNPNSVPSPLDEPQSRLQRRKDEDEVSRKPLWLQMAESDSYSTLNSNSNSTLNSNSNSNETSSDFDPEVISAFRKSLETLPPANPFHLKPLITEKEQALVGNDAGYYSLDVTDARKSLQNGFVGDGKDKTPPRGKEKLILYFTSLRGVRKTYEDCCHVRVILKATGVKVDERDVSMHSGFKEELKELLGNGFIGGGLPKVFVGKKYIGGADVIRRLHEDGQLEEVLEGCEMVDDSGGRFSSAGGGGDSCEACGDVRFLPCETCSGSCKIYCEGESDEVDEGEEGGEYGFQRCPDCNENGLIRCPICCD